MELEMDLGLYKEHNLWELMLVVVLDENMYHMKHPNMDLKHISLRLIITKRHIVLKKIDSYTQKTGKLGQEVGYFSQCFNSNYI